MYKNTSKLTWAHVKRAVAKKKVLLLLVAGPHDVVHKVC